MTKIAIIGSGIVGAAIAYELSRLPGLQITLFDEQQPASGATGASLGVLMGVISQKTGGRAWKLRQASLQRYQTLIPELESLTGSQIPCNRQGIVWLRFQGESVTRWQKLAETRRSQGYKLEIWDLAQLQAHCPQIEGEGIVGAVYSPQDWQISPTALTQALVAGAHQNGVDCQFGLKVQKIEINPLTVSNLRPCYPIQTTGGVFEVEGCVIAAGLGSTALAAPLAQVAAIRPVLGQAMQVKLASPLGNPAFQPIITGHDVHLVPLGGGEYWLGATVEFPNATGEVEAAPALLAALREEAIRFCPALATATILHTWYGKRPRPEGKAAPIIEELPGYSHIWLATGHYRNGVLLAPATALAIRDKIFSI